MSAGHFFVGADVPRISIYRMPLKIGACGMQNKICYISPINSVNRIPPRPCFGKLKRELWPVQWTVNGPRTVSWDLKVDLSQTQKCNMYTIFQDIKVFLAVTFLKLNIFWFCFFLTASTFSETFKNEVYSPKPHLWGSPTLFKFKNTSKSERSDIRIWRCF